MYLLEIYMSTWDLIIRSLIKIRARKLHINISANLNHCQLLKTSMQHKHAVALLTKPFLQQVDQKAKKFLQSTNMS